MLLEVFLLSNDCCVLVVLWLRKKTAVPTLELRGMKLENVRSYLE